MKYFRNIIVIVCACLAANFYAAAQTGEWRQSTGNRQSTAENRQSSNNFRFMLEKVADNYAKLESERDSMERVSTKAIEESESWKKEIVKQVKNSLYLLLRSPYNEELVNAYLEIIQKPERKWILDMKDIKVSYNQLIKYKEYNANLITFLKKINELAKGSNWYKVGDFIDKDNHLKIEKYNEIKSIPYLNSIIASIEQRMSNFTGSHNYDDFIAILECGLK